jgi:hypothetical protein
LINGCPIVWQSKKQDTTALSSTEAEYYAVTEAVKECLYLIQWFKVYRNETLIPIIRCDNQGAIHIASHSTNHNRTKHIDIKHHFVREHVNNKSIDIRYVSTKDQLADILTKAMDGKIFQKFRNLLLTH